MNLIGDNYIPHDTLPEYGDDEPCRKGTCKFYRWKFANVFATGFGDLVIICNLTGDDVLTKQMRSEVTAIIGIQPADKADVVNELKD